MKLYGTKTFRTISMIKIIPKKEHDKQNISCISTNSVASDFKSSQVTLKLLYKPDIKVTQSKTKGGEKPGDTVQFNCFSKATPRVTEIEWFLNDEKLPDESRDMLLLKIGRTDMNGARIKCVARNTIGSAADEIKIQLKCK
jgi:phage FluMu gp28-like protein